MTKKQSVKEWIAQEQGKHFCKCGCGGDIEIKRHHKVVGIPNFIYGHNNKGENNPGWKGGNVSFICDYCGDEFGVRRDKNKHSTNHFCSNECHGKYMSKNNTGENSNSWKGGDIEITCDYCMKIYTTAISKYNSYTNHFCSRGCLSLWMSDNLSGENSHNYNPNLTDEERSIGRFIPGYQEWRKAVYERDDYTCQMCGKNGGTLNAHHIESYNNNKELRTELSNGITLCEDHHKDFHHQYGNNNTRKQLIEFMEG